MTDLYVDLIAHAGENFQSASIDSIAYNRDSETLYIEFVSGDAIYGYEGVSESTYNLLLNADSLNHFWRDHISGQYDSARYDGSDTWLDDWPLKDWERELLNNLKVGDRVYVNYPPAPVWDGEGVITDISGPIYVVNFDRARYDSGGFESGGFESEYLSPVNDVQPDTKWLTPEGEALGAVNAAAGTSRWTVGYLLSLGNGSEQPFETEYLHAASEADALVQFNAEIAKAEAFVGPVTVKVQKVTHYFD